MTYTPEQWLRANKLIEDRKEFRAPWNNAVATCADLLDEIADLRRKLAALVMAAIEAHDAMQNMNERLHPDDVRGKFLRLHILLHKADKLKAALDAAKVKP